MVPAEGFTIMCLSLERTRVVREPFQTESRPAAIRKIALIWTAALALELPRGLFFYTYDETCESFYKCRNVSGPISFPGILDRFHLDFVAWNMNLTQSV